jgi:hypothetical protein
MKRKGLLTLGVAALAAVTVLSVAIAGSAHFVGTPTITTTSNSVTVAGKIAGLGNVPQINVAITGDAQCVNPGSNKPKAGNKQSVAANDDFPVQNGKADFNVTATVSFQPDCTPPMTVEFSNLAITVTDPDGNVLLTFP